MRSLPFLVAAAILLPVTAIAAPQTVTVDRSTPEKTVQSVLDALLRGDLSAIAECVSGATVSPNTSQLAADMKNSRTPPGSKAVLVEPVAKEKGDGTTILYYQVQLDVNGQTIPQSTEFVDLRKEGDGWKIIPPPVSVLEQTGGAPPRNTGLVQTAALMASHPEIFLKARDTARSAASLSNVKQICLGLMMLSQDYDDKLPVKPETFKKTVMPYIKSEQVFTSPLDKSGTVSYRFNAKLANANMTKIKNPAKTVMVYEGEWGKPLFRYDGKAVIGFADGHAKLMTPEEVKGLLWTP